MDLEGKEVEVTLLIKLKTVIEDVPENNKEVVRYLIEDDLEKLGYEIEYTEIIE